MNIGTTEIIVILVLALLLYGKRLPEITRALGKGYREFKKNIDNVKKDLQDQVVNISSDINIKEMDKIYNQSEPAQPNTGLPQIPAVTESTKTDSENKDTTNLAG